MRLKRNDPASDGRGKYGVVKVDRVAALSEPEKTTVQTALDFLEQTGVLTYGGIGEADEFFVVMLKDVCSPCALVAYAAAARVRCDDPEYADEVEALASRAGYMSPFCKKPD